MQLILLEKVDNLGSLGEVVNVKAGYARNFLVPSGKAKIATPDNMKVFEERRAELERFAAEKLGDAEMRRKRLDGAKITIIAKAGTEGKLFGSVGTSEIGDALAAQEMTVEKREIRLPDGPLRMVGEHEVTLHLHSEVDVTITVVVTAEEE